MIRARAQAGVNRARQNVSRSGKPLGRPKTDATIAAAIRASLAAGISIRQAAKLHSVGVSTVQRVKFSTG
jgi:DNA invertase Pin-like site-specific DNA recombinase